MINKEIIEKLYELYREYMKKGLETNNHLGENDISVFLAWLEIKYSSL